MEIVLLRHGKPNTKLSGYLSTKEFKQFICEYAKSDIQDSPTEKLKTKFNGYHVICSDLPRSIGSAKKLNFKNIHLSDALFKEADMPYFNKFNLRLPLTLWVVLLRIMWVFGFSKNSESFLQAKNRSKQAAEQLINLAQKNEKVIVVGHGLMNRLIGKQLKSRGWHLSEKRGKSYWEFSQYRFSF